LASGTEGELKLNEILALGEALTAAINGRDADALDRIYGPEAVVWRSYSGVVETREQNIAWLSAFFQRAAEIKYHDIRRQQTERGFVQQHVITITLKDGTAYEPRPVCMVVEVKGGLIARIDEYLEAGRIANGGGVVAA
jgi:hypothetical protein